MGIRRRLERSAVRWSARARKRLIAFEDRARSRRPVTYAWANALDGEISFWRRQLLTYHRPADRTDATAPFQPNVARYIEAPKGSKVRVLDVGAGPLTWIGKTHSDYDVELRAADTLGERYGELFDEIGIGYARNEAEEERYKGLTSGTSLSTTAGS